MKQRKKIRNKDGLYALILLTPSFILLTIFGIIPIVLSFFSSFTDGNDYIGFTFVGFKNYLNVFQDSYFTKSLLTGFKYVLIIVPIQIILAYFLANLIIKLKNPLQSIVKVCIYIPCVLSGIVIGAIFMYLFEYNSGFINQILGIFSIDKIAWLNDPKYAIIAVSIASIYSGVGYVTLVMLGGLLDIPKDYYEAAEIDGASSFKKAIFITIPLLKNVAVYLLISCFVSTFQLFELPFIMTGGGPLSSTLGPVGLLYQHFNWDSTIGYTAASSVIIALFLAILSSIIFKLVNSSKSEE
jgi:ABC-type sugar transport system permease subunit